MFGWPMLEGPVTLGSMQNTVSMIESTGNLGNHNLPHSYAYTGVWNIFLLVDNVDKYIHI